MAKNFLLIIFILASQFVISQNKSLRIANEEYLKSNYKEVINKYNFIKRTKYALQFSDYIKIAHSYYNLGDYKNSKIYYDKVFDNSYVVSRNHIFNYLHLNLVYQDSLNYGKVSRKFNISDNIVDKYFNKNSTVFLIDSLKIIDSLSNKFNYFEDNNHFYTQILKNGFSQILFRSKDSLNFTPLFKFDFEINQGHFTFTKNSDIIYITLNENNGKRLIYSNKKSYLKIYEINLKDSLNESLKLISIDQKKYNFSNPVFSNDFKKLYFVSDMKGGYGSTDIYYVDINDDNSFSEIKNIGPQINTNNREGYITIDSDNNLYFSSNGHSGFGGLDIFKINLNEENSYPINLGSKINSKYDEFYFHKYENSFYFSSNRNGIDKAFLASPNNLVIDKNIIDIVNVSKNLKSNIFNIKEKSSDISNNNESKDKLAELSKRDAKLSPFNSNSKTILASPNNLVIDKNIIDIVNVSKNLKSNIFNIKEKSSDISNNNESKDKLAELSKRDAKLSPFNSNSKTMKRKIFHVILGSFRYIKEANNLKLTLLNTENVEPNVLEKTDLGFYRVSINEFKRYKDAFEEMKRYVDKGYLDAWVAVYISEK